MKQPSPSIVCRLPGFAFDAFCNEAIRQVRPLPQIINGAARAFLSLSPDDREAFTIGDGMPPESRARLGLKPAGQSRPNRRKPAPVIETAASMLAKKGGAK